MACAICGSRTPQASASGLGLFQDLLVAQLHAEVRELVARGLRRRYVARSEELASPRGRIDMLQNGGRARGYVCNAPLSDTTRGRATFC